MVSSSFVDQIAGHLIVRQGACVEKMMLKDGALARAESRSGSGAETCQDWSVSRNSNDLTPRLHPAYSVHRANCSTHDPNYLALLVSHSKLLLLVLSLLRFTYSQHPWRPNRMANRTSRLGHSWAAENRGQDGPILRELETSFLVSNPIVLQMTPAPRSYMAYEV